MVEPSFIRPGLLVVCLYGAADILLLSSAPARSGVFFFRPARQNGRMNAFRDAARVLLERESGRLPDLSGVIVLVPHRHLARPFLEALRARVDGVFLPPRLTTLPELAASLPGAAPAMSTGRRLSMLHALTRGFEWLDAAARWPTAFALHDLIEEMDAALLAPPDAFAGFAAQLAGLGRRMRAAPLQREAELIYRVWRAFQEHGASPGRDYAERLGRVAATHAGRVYHLGLADTTRLERRFLERADLGAVALPLPARYPERAAFLRLAWPEAPDAAEAPAARAARAAVLDLGDAPEWLVAADLESEARAAATRIRAWLAEGRRDIAVVALDRLVARRLRALLERDAILMRDETGWTCDTAASSHVMDRLLRIHEDDAYFRDVLDLLKSPFPFADANPAWRADLPAFENALARASLIRGLEGMRRLAGELGHADLAARLVDIASARQALAGGARPLGDWQRDLLGALRRLGATSALARDFVGAQLLALLRALEGEMAGDPTRYAYREWCAWLDARLARATFHEDDIDSPIRMTHLKAARLRPFDAALILGAGAAGLPGGCAPGLFNDAARQQLGLPGLRQARAETRAALLDVLGHAGAILFTWRGDDSAGAPSPWLESLDVFHRLVHGRGLKQAAPPAALLNPPRSGLAPAPPPSLAGAPARLGASAWQAMLDCPYRFFARHGLGLRAADEAVEVMAKRDYGEHVHALLMTFHDRHARLAETPRARLAADLDACAAAEFGAAAETSRLALAWRARWQRRRDAYLDWALRHEAAGYRVDARETERERTLSWAEGAEVCLHGRLDRLDTGPDGVMVLDYKTQSRQALVGRLKVPGEDAQLPFYGLLAGATRAALVCLDDARVEALELAEPLASAMAAEAERLRATWRAIAAGAALPATGAPATCQYCEARGLCRREHGAFPEASPGNT
jgi:ATP-dependent helicase/nuclease subunit B